MIKPFLMMLIITFLAPVLVAQSSSAGCSGEKMKEFAFWVGDWDLEWKTSDGKIQQGTNKIGWILDGCVLREEFDGGKELPLKGQSYTMLDRNSGQWKQTWVDNQGSYLDFSGGLQEGKMILSRSFENKEGRQMNQRMVFFNITRESLDWNWENSTDGGKTWNLAWHIRYKRSPE